MPSSNFSFSQWPVYASVFLMGIAVGYKLRKPFYSFSKRFFTGSSKLVLVVRDDLKLGKGKMAAQCCHATMGVYLKAVKFSPDIVDSWTGTGQQKVVLRAHSLEEIFAIQQVAEQKGIITYLVRDAGRTQVAPGTQTVLAIGPDSIDKIDEVSGHLRLM